jgi:HEPN domain-containing protein
MTDRVIPEDLAIPEEWFRFASDDLTVAKACFENMYPKKLAIACYHCQQSAEKALKGFLISQGIEHPKIHNLETICEMCMKQDASFSEIHEVSSKLSPYGVAAKYPSETVIDEIITQTAIKRAQTIFAFCRAKVPVVI